MRDFVKLTGHDNKSLYISTSMILSVTEGHSNGSAISMAMSNEVYRVKESPSEVIKLITTHYKTHF